MRSSVTDLYHFSFISATKKLRNNPLSEKVSAEEIITDRYKILVSEILLVFTVSKAILINHKSYVYYKDVSLNICPDFFRIDFHAILFKRMLLLRTIAKKP